MDQILEQDAGGNREENVDPILEQAREYHLRTKVCAEQYAAEAEEPNVCKIKSTCGKETCSN